ncbi:right-handed parallel beta-helix repeat-containing protein [Cellulophaga sp. Hel_I_12]|uniref:right-handed parallel beta-helix repeat-containing protein n=1 Tax=Cellulophaga sp. Hel_I_12 TaxID=1249972 RepID=UPI000645A57B|nr:right-handed parallel beta-helix repeat-containing protein [Cellulophaga sp. Hel_I_12]
MRKPHFFLTYLLFFSLIVTFTFSSCTQDDLISNILEDATAEEPVPDPADPSDPADPITTKPINTLAINTTPCEYTLASLNANETLKIACQLNLDGQTITLPANVVLEYDGGEIINGSLSFNGGKIDGALLNQNLEVSGNVTLIDPNFSFYPERWDIVQGKTTSDRAQKNNNNLEDVMFFTQSIGATAFNIDSFDAYFEISKVTSTTTNQNFYPSLEAINIPSNFNLIMTDNTHFRIYPNNGEAGVLIAFREVSNSSIQGGTLHGDRDEHDYTTSRPGEGGNHLMEVQGAKNIVIDGVKFTMGSKGGLFINSVNFTFQPNYIPTRNVRVKNCLFESNRRMATAITDGYDIVIENNTYSNTAVDRPKSDGGVVGYAINIEAVRTRDANGEFIFYEKAQDIVIRNNKEVGSRIGGITVSIGENVTIENNDMENKIVYSATSGTKIRNNTLTASEKSSKTPAILAAGIGETVFNNEIYGNKISGYGVGIAVYEGKLKIYDNQIIDCNNGIQLKDLTDTDIFKNTINSSLSTSRGISLQLTYGNNVNIFENNVKVEANHLYFVALNEKVEQEANIINIKSNNFTSKGATTFSRTHGVVFENNTTSSLVQLVNTKNIVINKNTISNSNGHGIFLMAENKSVRISNNNIAISESGNYECVKIASTTNLAEVVLNNNACR